jgi:phage/plasmid-like protein (TIGR03299 family)
MNMSHNLEQIDEQASFAYNVNAGDPWHRLGVPVDGEMTPQEALESARADYIVTKEPIFGHFQSNGTKVQVEDPDRRATMRQNPVTNKPELLGVVGSGYVVVQNSDVMARAYDVVGASEDEAHVDTCGVLDGGRRFFSYINLGDLVIDPEGINDKIERGLAIYSSHDGTIAVTYAFTDIRVVCQNTVTAAVEGASRVFRAKHTTSVSDRMAEAQRVLGVSTEWAKQFSKMAEDMLGTAFTEDRFTKVLDQVFPLPHQPTERQKNNNSDVRSAVREIFYNDRNAKVAGKNGWSMYNSVVEYLDHGRADVSEDKRLLATMDPREKSWVNTRKINAQKAVLALA